MTPCLAPGDRLGIEWWSAEVTPDCRPGELVLAREGAEGWILHRVVERTPTGTLVTRGDRAYAAESLHVDQVFGRVRLIQFASELRVRPFRVNRLDRAIAWLSSRGSPGRPTRALIRSLGWLRRELL